MAVKARGGLAVVQDPADALYSGMPDNALQHVAVDHVLPAAAMGELLARLATEPATEPPGPAPTDMKMEVEMEQFSLDAVESSHPGEPSGFSCPDCNGVLWAIQDGGLERFRCRVGHAWSPESLITRQSESLEAALWMALRSLEEQASEAQQAARVVRNLLLDRDSFATAWPLTGDRPNTAKATEETGG